MTDKKFIKKIDKLFKKKFGKDIDMSDIQYGYKDAVSENFTGNVSRLSMTIFVEVKAYTMSKKDK